MYLLFQVGGHSAQAELWRWRGTGRLVLHELGVAEIGRMEVLMAKYRDRPMDLADASIVAAAEQLGVRRIFTLDGDFRIYRLAGELTLACIP
jgi:predicted nucleic acid-binding protein